MIFKVLSDEILPLLAIEIRHPTTKEVSFAVIDYQKSTLLFDGLGLDESWWVGLTGFVGGKLFFHTFEDKEYPAPKGMIVADALEQALLWEKKGAYIEEITENEVLISFLENDTKKIQLLDNQTGNSLEKSSDQQRYTVNQVIFPSQYEAGTGYFETVSNFLKQKFGVIPVQQLDYLEFGDYIVIAYLTEGGSFILILNQIGEVLFHQIMDSKTNSVGAESFFMVNNFIISIADRKKLLIFKL